MANPTAVEGAHFLTQSPARVHILESLYEAGHLEKHELRDRVDASRVTVRRNVDALTERGWVDSEDGVCSITALGELVVEDVFPALETVGVAERLRPFVRWFPDDDLDFDLRALEDATVVVAEASNPYAPVNRHLEVIQEADRFRCLLPAVGLQPMTVVRDRVLEDGQEQEVVFGKNVASTLREEREYAAVIEELLEVEHCALWLASEELDYYLGLCEQCVQIGVEDDDGMPRALVETDAVEVRGWAEETYERYRSRADRFIP